MAEMITVRELRADDDVDGLVRIAVAAWEPIYAMYRQAMGEEMFLTLHPDWPAEKGGQVRRACEPESGALVCVAEREGRVVGFATYYVDRGRGMAEIGNNAVEPSCRGQGIGPLMYGYIFEQLRRRGAQYVTVHTGGDPAHAPARRAYEKAGFDVKLSEVAYLRKL